MPTLESNYKPQYRIRDCWPITAGLLLWSTLSWGQGTTLAVPPGSIVAIAPDHYRLDAPITTSPTKGLQEAIDMCPLTGCVIDVGPGEYDITKTCAQWVQSENPGTGARITGDGTVGGGAILIANHRNLMIRGSGRQLTHISWSKEFSVTSCGLGAQSSGIVTSIFRLDSAPPPFETTDIVFRDLSIEIAQTNLSLANNQIQGISAIDIGPTGTIDVVEVSNVYAECKQKASTAAGTVLARCISIGTGGSNTQSHTPRGIDINHSFIESSGVGVYQLFGERTGVWDNWLGTVNESGYGCSPELLFKRNGPMDVQRNVFEFRGDSTLCGSVAPRIRFMQLDARNGADFPGTGITVAGNIFIVGGALWADMFFEGIYMTGYSYVNITNNKFWCTRDFEDTDTAGKGDGNLDACQMMVIQVDSTNTGGGRVCNATTPCNEAVSVIANQFVNFRDNIPNDDWAGDPAVDGCPIQIAVPADAEDNQYGIFALNTFKIVDVNGNLDTGPLANGFCGQGGTGYLKKNIIYGNSVVGKAKHCLAGDGITCAVELDLPTQALTFVPRTYTVATLPAAAASNSGQVVIATDSAAGLCTVGGGAILVWCRSNGAAWVDVK